MHTTLQKLWNNPKTFLKAAAAVIILLFIASLGLQLVGKTMQSFGRGEIIPFTSRSSFGGVGMMQDHDFAEEAMMEKSMAPMPSMPPPIDGGFTGGDDAEDFEVTEHNAHFRTRNKDHICDALSTLKAFEYIVFENSNVHEYGCNYSFKVEHSYAEEVLSKLEDLDPESISENTYTIKRSVDSVTSEVEILEQKLESINETLENALSAYDEISRIATNSRDAESLATIIDSKIRLIERLSQDRINVNTQLMRLERNRQQQLDRLDYTYFHTSVSEEKYIDFKQLKDSWKFEIQSFVRDTNSIVQGISVGIIVFSLYVVQYVLYFFILLFVAKYGWKHAQRIWKQ